MVQHKTHFKTDGQCALNMDIQWQTQTGFLCWIPSLISLHHTHTGVFAHAAQQKEYTVHIHKHREQAQSYIETFPVVTFLFHRFKFAD